MLNRKRRLIKIEDINIVISEEGLKNFNSMSQWSPQYAGMMRKVYGGYCNICMSKPDKIATFHVGKGTLIERYCNEHLFHIFDNLDGIDEKIEIIKSKG
jgi:hypothetical protein